MCVHRSVFAIVVMNVFQRLGLISKQMHINVPFALLYFVGTVAKLYTSKTLACKQLIKSTGLYKIITIIHVCHR